MTAATAAPRRRDWPTYIGLGILGVVAVAWSFTALSDLARQLGITAEIPLGDRMNSPRLPVAWGLPITLDVLAIIATRMWLQGRASPEAVRYARRTAWAAIVASVGGNAYHGWLTGHGRVDVVIVSAVPAVAVGVVVHAAVLSSRGPGEAGDNRATSPGRLVRWRAAGTAWWEMRKAERKAADDRRADAGGDRAETGRTAVPTGVDSNDVLAADLRRLNAARQAKGEKPLGRDAVIARYKPIGSTRAQTVLDMAARPEPTDGLHVVPNQEEAAG